MIHNDDIEEKEMEAFNLIDEADSCVDKGDGDSAITLYERAAQIYIDLGSYMKLDELFIQISAIILRFKNKIQSVYRLKSIIRKTEELKLYEISAKLLINLGNISNEMQDWETAGECFQKASDFFFESDPEEYYNLSTLLMLKAGQAFEKSHIKKKIGKHLILKSIMKINKFDELYQIEEKRGNKLVSMKEFEPAAKKFIDIASYFRKALDTIEETLAEDNETSKTTIMTAKARFIHFVAEYQTVAALCLRASKNRDFNEKIKKLSLDSLELFKQSISLMKEYLLIKEGDFHKEELLRITFDMMLMGIIQGIIGTKILNPINYLLEGIEGRKRLIKHLKETPYFKITEQLEKVGLREMLDTILKTHLGHFETIKNTLISFFQ